MIFLIIKRKYSFFLATLGFILGLSLGKMHLASFTLLDNNIIVWSASLAMIWAIKMAWLALNNQLLKSTQFGKMFKIGQEVPAQSSKCMQILTSASACLGFIWPLIMSVCNAHLSVEDVMDLRIALKKILKEIK